MAVEFVVVFPLVLASWAHRLAPVQVYGGRRSPVVTLEARATTTRFDLEDGARLTCEGTGVPYDLGRPGTAQSSDCTHAWEATSEGKTLSARATVTWAVFYEARQVAAHTDSSDLELAVAEAQALDRRPDPMSGAEAAANAATDQPNAAAGGGRPLSDLAGLVPVKDHRNWFQRALAAAGGFLSDVAGWGWSGIKDLKAGVWDGVAGLLSFVWEFSTIRALFDWDGFSQSVSGLTEAIRSDPFGFLKEMGKGFVAWDYWAAGKPLKAIGTMVPGAVLAFFTGGASLAAKVDQGAGKGIPAATRVTNSLDEVADGAKATRGLDDVARGPVPASTSWGRTVQDFQQYGGQWRRVSAHAEAATGRAYRGGTSIEEVFERGVARLVRHRIYGPNGEILHETFRPYAKFGAP